MNDNKFHVLRSAILTNDLHNETLLSLGIDHHYGLGQLSRSACWLVVWSLVHQDRKLRRPRSYKKGDAGGGRWWATLQINITSS